jgi:hypothetical protein
VQSATFSALGCREIGNVAALGWSGHLNKGRVTIYTRNGHDWTKRFHTIAEGSMACVSSA